MGEEEESPEGGEEGKVRRGGICRLTTYDSFVVRGLTERRGGRRVTVWRREDGGGISREGDEEKDPDAAEVVRESVVSTSRYHFLYSSISLLLN